MTQNSENLPEKPAKEQPKKGADKKITPKPIKVAFKILAVASSVTGSFFLTRYLLKKFGKKNEKPALRAVTSEREKLLENGPAENP